MTETKSMVSWAGNDGGGEADRQETRASFMKLCGVTTMLHILAKVAQTFVKIAAFKWMHFIWHKFHLHYVDKKRLSWAGEITQTNGGALATQSWIPELDPQNPHLKAGSWVTLETYVWLKSKHKQVFEWTSWVCWKYSAPVILKLRRGRRADSLEAYWPWPS